MAVTRTRSPSISSIVRTGVSRVIRIGGLLAQTASTRAWYSCSIRSRARNSASVQSSALSQTSGRVTTLVIGNTSPV